MAGAPGWRKVAGMITRLRNAFDWTAEGLYVADMLLLGLIVFFILTGALNPFTSLTAVIVLAFVLVIWGAHRVWMKHHPDIVDSAHHRARERRGF